MSGRRYGEHAGLLADACVPIEIGTDGTDSGSGQPTSITSVEPRGTDTEDTEDGSGTTTSGDATTMSMSGPATSTTAVDSTTTEDPTRGSTTATDESSSSGAPLEDCFVDLFDGDSLHPSWLQWADDPISVGLTDDALRVEVPAFTTGWGGVTSSLVFTDNSRANVLINNAGGLMTAHEAVLELLADTGDRLILMYSGGRARVIFDLMGAETTLAEQEVSEGPEGLWLQIRVDDGDLSFETSIDGSTYAAFHSLDVGNIRDTMAVPNVYAGTPASIFVETSVAFGSFEFCTK